MFFRIAFLLAFASVGLIIGGCYGLVRTLIPSRADLAAEAERGPAPHHVPPQAGGIAFRFAMVHDVLHERFPKHGEAYHRERERRLRERLATTPPDVPAFDDDTDDLAIALARLNRREEAIQLLRAKLGKQSAADKSEAVKYTTFSNLGAILMEDSEAKAAAGDPDAANRFAEGAAFAKRAHEANPKAHFGRTEWQVKWAEFVRGGLAKPELFKQRDFIGNDLEYGVEVMYSMVQSRLEGFGSKIRPHHEWRVHHALKDDEPYSDPSHWREFEAHRASITRVGAVNDSEEKGVPFDIPMLAAVGIWRQTPEPSPHLALGIGETMVRVGQRSLAWCAFERAAKSETLREHCRSRQKELETSLGINGEERRREHEAERAFGESWQKEYQDFEARQIAKGVPLENPEFYKEFFTGQESIASPSGEEEIAVSYPPWAGSGRRERSAWTWALVGAAIGAWCFAVFIRLRRAFELRWRGASGRLASSR
jgi:hypothetical protein